MVALASSIRRSFLAPSSISFASRASTVRSISPGVRSPLRSTPSCCSPAWNARVTESRSSLVFSLAPSSSAALDSSASTLPCSASTSAWLEARDPRSSSAAAACAKRSPPFAANVSDRGLACAPRKYTLSPHPIGPP
eukprot:1000915-Prorocentrum_minimum.AAC.4